MKYLAVLLLSVFASAAFAAQDISKMTDDEFLDMVERDSVNYFVKKAHPQSGLIAYDSVNTHIGSNGFALNAFCIAAERKYIPREEAAQDVLKMLETFKNVAANYDGAFQWMSDAATATQGHSSSFDIVETSYVCAGALVCKQYFDGSSETEAKIRQLADEIYGRVQFDRFMLSSKGEKKKTLAWSYETDKKHFSDFRVKGYNECIIVYIMALGSPEHPADNECWDGWANSYSWRRCFGYEYYFCPALFTHQYSFCWLDLRDLQDKYTKIKNITYFENSRRAALSHIEYAKENPKNFPEYGPIWGLTDCGCPLHSSGFGGHGVLGNDDGTVAVSASGASIMFTPKESIACLRYIYTKYGDKMYDEFGFRNAFNLKTGWFDTNHDMLNKGAMLTAIENYRSGLIWKLFMKNPEVRSALKKAGFRKAVIEKEKQAAPSKFQVSTVLDPMESADNLSTYRDKGASMKAEKVKSEKGNALQVSYDLSGGKWVGFHRPVHYNMSGFAGISFDYYSEGPDNNIEVKVEDAHGSVFGFIFPSSTGNSGWISKNIPFEDMWHFWGGDNKLNLSKVQISFAISKDEGGTGRFVIRNLCKLKKVN